MVLNKYMIVKYAEIESIQPILDLEKKWKCEKIDQDMHPYNLKEIKKAILDKRIIIAKYNSKEVGFLFFEIDDKNKTCELDAIYVEKSYRKRGVGNLLMNFFLNIDRVKSCHKIYLLADSIFEDKIVSFYNKYGFKKVAVKMLKNISTI